LEIDNLQVQGCRRGFPRYEKPIERI